MRLHNIKEGWSRLPDIDREKYQERSGLEGPIMTRSGKVIYYDPKAGDYIDPDTDMYLSYSDFKALDDENMYKIDEFEFNPRAGHRDQMSHPENRGLGRNPPPPRNPPTPKPRPKNLAPKTSPRPKARPANLQMRHDINKAVRSVVGEAGGYYTQPVYDMIEKHGYEKVMAELLSKLDADVIQDFLNRADFDESVSETLSPEEKKLVAKMYNKDGTLTDLGKKVMGEGEVSDEDKEKAMKRALQKSDEPERGEKRKKVTLKKAPWEESVNEAEKRWKQTSMSPEEAIKQYGKENVKVKKGGLRNGDDMVSVFVENTQEIDEGLSDVVKSVGNTFKRGLKSLTNRNNRPAKNPQPNQHTVRAGSGGTSIAQKINWGGKFDESSDNPAMDKALRSIEKSFGPERKAIDDQVTAMCRTAEMLGSDRFKDRAFSVVEQYGIHNKQELLQELQLMIRNEQAIDDDEIHGPDSNIKRMKKAIEKIGSMEPTNEAQIMTEAQFDEAAGEKDACYRKVKSRYKVWPSAYASGALVKCRKVGASNWGNSKK